ncbi:MAG: hypothetical protein VX800_01565 [Chloroflexota bacterium]|nr:hypothetical protein [Chloroflexota bacterium]
MRKTILGLTIFVSTLLVACGGGGGDGSSGGGGGGNATPTPHFGEVEGYTGETAVAEFSMTNAGWDVKDVTIPAGHFKVRLTNNGGKIRQLIAQRWKVQLQAEPGETRDSPVYVEMVPGTYPCFEAGRGSKPQWKCNIIIE